ncbi:MAG: hypoxanthine phosphoribosyltransferase [Clostridiales bacterium]|nr:MAG: hypoxanthine phosphoribosyltransferase [Clostridiales bacterium]
MDKLEVMISEQQIKDCLKEMGKQITEDYKENSNLLLVSILKGSVVFLADLMRNIDLPLAIDFMVASSYGSGTESRGNVKIIKDLDVNISDYDILIVEDILDSGYTLSKIIEILKTRNPKSLKVCALLNKPDRRVSPVNLDYTGFVIEDKFIVGYGLDYDEKYRNLPYIGILQ